MATLYYPTTGNFSTATPKVVDASYMTIGAGGSQYDSLSTTRYQAFTAATAGSTMEGAIICLTHTGQAGTSVIVTLQENTGSWVDVAGATCTIALDSTDMTGVIPIGASTSWVYFPFTTPATITTDANKWRLKVAESGTSFRVSWRKNGTTSYGFAVVLTGTTTYTSGDDAWLGKGQTFTVDQSMAFTNLAVMVDTVITCLTPASSYSFTITNFYQSNGYKIIYGTSTVPIPYAQQQTIGITNWYNGYTFDGASYYQNCYYKLYGEVPTYQTTNLFADANSGQKDIVTTEDMSSNWTVGDTVYIYGARVAGGYESRTISSMSGTTITLNSNLTYPHYDGWRVVNYTRAIQKGIYLSQKFGHGIPSTFEARGLLMNDGTSLRLYDNFGSGAVYTPEVTNWYFNDIFLKSSAFIYMPYLINYLTMASCEISDIISVSNSSYGSVAVTANAFTQLNLQRHTLGATATGSSQTLINSTLNDIQISGGAFGNTYYLNTLILTSCTVTNLKFLGNSTGTRGVFMQLINTTITNLEVDACYYGLFLSTFINSTITNLNLGANYANAISDILDNTAFVNAQFENTSTFSVASNRLANALIGSYIAVAGYNNTSTDHRVWWNYGQTTSTGDGLTDTTVHTSGTGKFALRFEPLSSTNNLTWDFDIPTGNISTKTMTVGVWCKINSATYYAGTHQLPRLTIDYDNGTTAYHQAGESTDWQLLFVTFTPTTTYGQITVTLSGRTDATSTDAYIYWDDFGVAYPPSVALDLGGMDYFANGLPVTPPLAIPISAGTVAQQVWQQLTTTSWGTNSMGEQVKDSPGKVWDELVADHLTAGTFGKLMKFINNLYALL